MAPARQLDERRFVNFLGVFVDELPRAGAVEVLRDVDHHSGAHRDDALGLGTPAGATGVDDGELRRGRILVLRVVEGEVVARLEIQRHRDLRARGDRSVAALQRELGEERVVVTVQDLVDGHAVVEAGDEDVMDVDVTRLGLQVDVDEAARHLRRHGQRGVGGGERDDRAVAAGFRRRVFVAAAGERRSADEREARKCGEGARTCLEHWKSSSTGGDGEGPARPARRDLALRPTRPARHALASDGDDCAPPRSPSHEDRRAIS